MPSAGDPVQDGRIPGQRIATQVETIDSTTFTGVETQVTSVTASLVSGRTYRVVADIGFEITVDGVLRAQVHEDSTSGTVLQIRDTVIDNSGTAQSMHAETQYTATTTANKTFVVTGDVRTGGGTANMNAGSTFPSYLYIDYVSG